MILMHDNDIIKFILDRVDVLGGFHIESVRQVLGAVEFIVKNHIKGDLVEVGVFRGIMVLCMLLKLEQMGDTSRKIHLYDTFSGMTEASDVDVDPGGTSGSAELKSNPTMCLAPLDVVKNNIVLADYPSENIYYHMGDVRLVDPDTIPSEIAFLRLDTDFYDSTKYELEHFEPRVVDKGVVCIDDYGWWQGATKAVDEFDYKYKMTKMKPHGIWWVKD